MSHIPIKHCSFLTVATNLIIASAFAIHQEIYIARLLNHLYKPFIPVIVVLETHIQYTVINLSLEYKL